MQKKKARLHRQHIVSLLALTFVQSIQKWFCAHGGIRVEGSSECCLLSFFVCLFLYVYSLFSVPSIWFNTTNPQEFGVVELGYSMFTCLNPHLINQKSLQLKALLFFFLESSVHKRHNQTVLVRELNITNSEEDIISLSSQFLIEGKNLQFQLETNKVKRQFYVFTQIYTHQQDIDILSYVYSVCSQLAVETEQQSQWTLKSVELRRDSIRTSTSLTVQ